MAFSEADPATWNDAPVGYVWLTVDQVTGELHLFAPDGRNVSGGPGRDEIVPDGAVNAVIARVMADEAFRQESADMWAKYGERHPYQYCDMRPVVHEARPLDPELHRGDCWYIEVQYSSKGGRAAYGVNRNHVPTCYAN